MHPSNERNRKAQNPQQEGGHGPIPRSSGDPALLIISGTRRVASALHGRESHKQCPRAGAMGMAGASHPSSAQLRLRTSPGHVSLLSPAALSQADGWAGTWAGGGARIGGYHLGACKSWQHRPGGRGVLTTEVGSGRRTASVGRHPSPALGPALLRPNTFTETGGCGRSPGEGQINTEP